MTLTLTRIPSASARALASPVRLPSLAAACAFPLPVPLRPSPAASALALALCLPPPPAAACAFARPWRLSPSTTACRLSMVAFLPLPFACALCPSPRPIAVSSVSSGHLVPCLDHATLQLRKPDINRRAFGRRSANGPWPPFSEGVLGWVRLGGADVGVAGLAVGAVHGARPALSCGRGGPWRLAGQGALGPRWAGPARRRRTGGRGAVGWGAGSGPMRPVRRLLRGRTCEWGGGGNSLLGIYTHLQGLQ